MQFPDVFPAVSRFVPLAILIAIAAHGTPASAQTTTTLSSAETLEATSLTAPASTGWTTIASEGQSFKVAGTQTVRYGAGSTWLTRTVTDSGKCDRTFFGGDPAHGVVKHCEVSGATMAQAEASVIPPATPICTPPIAAANTAGVAASVGNGTPQSCTEAALRAAIASHTTVTFNCGALPATIAISRTIDVPSDRNIVIDGANKITLDGGGRTRILSVVRENFRTNPNTLTLQRITLANGRAVGTRYVAPSTSNPSCAYGYGHADGGGAVYVRDTKLQVIGATFRNNAAATPGPDVGGGAIFAAGALDVTVVGSTFVGNTGSNAGAVGLLQTNGRFYNNVFANNVANGTGGNYAGGKATGCPGVGHANQGGAGGNGGAIEIDGSNDTDLMVCGSRFIDNRSNELAGALGRVSNGLARRTTIDRSLFQGNRAMRGGALFVMNSKPLDILASTFTGNVAKGGGAAQFSSDRLNIVNSSFVGNEATAGLGGALFHGGSDATSVIRNVTFSGNKSSGGAGFFSAAIGGAINFPIYNTVFANNLTNDAWSPMQCWFSPSSGASNTQWPRNRVLGGALDTACTAGVVFANPLLGLLLNNGGPTPTVMPASTSPLRGAGRNCPATDQRGAARNTALCTIGAVE